MASKTFDPDAFKAGQRRDWHQAAEGWRKWWQPIEALLRTAGERLIDLTAIRPGERVLDLATGVGEPALSAARVVGLEGRVVGTDIAPGMLEIARGRAKEAGLDNAEFLEMDAEALEFPESSFDVVLCRFGLMFLPDVEAALRGIRRVLVPGGRFAASVWGPPERVPFNAVILGTVARVLELPPPAPGTPGLFALTDAIRLEELIRGAGFVDVATEAIELRGTLPTLDDFVTLLQDVGAPIHNLLEGKPPELREKVWGAVAEASKQFVGSDGRVHLSGEAILVSGRK
jgi:SAM-dependent methyltransferase